MAPRSKKALKVTRVKCKATKLQNSLPTTHRTLTDLPVELLHIIVSQVYRRYTLLPCSLTCWKLREVALEVISFRRPTVRDMGHFLTFMRDRPRIGLSVTSLTIFDSSLDANVVDDMIRLFPNLSTLHLTRVNYAPPPRPQDAGDLTVLPPRLSRVVIIDGTHVSGTMHLLSVLRPKDVFLSFDSKQQDDNVFDPRCLAGFPSVEHVFVSTHWAGASGMDKSFTRAVDALSKTLAPDSLQSMSIKYSSKSTLRAYERMLECVGRRITELRVFADTPRTRSERASWENPLNDWRLLKIHACSELRSLEIPIYVPQKKPNRAASHVGADILIHAPASLRRITIELYDVARPTTLGNRVLLKLQEFDKVVTPNRFPHLEEFKLCIKVTDELYAKGGYWEECVASARRALPGLHSRGLLDAYCLNTW